MGSLTVISKAGSRKLSVIILVLAFCGAMILTLSGGATARAADNDIFDSAWGTFHNPDRPDDLEIECLQYGTNDPAVFDTDPAIQTSAAETLNQIRSGQIPDGVPIFGGTCSSDPGAETGFGSSGLGFAGASGQEVVGDYFEIGRFFHFNRTVERSLRTVELATTITVVDPANNTPTSFDARYLVSIEETSDFAGVADTSLCDYDVPENRIINQLGIDGTFCADRLTIEEISPFSVQLTDSTVDFQVTGFARVVDDECDPTQVVEGDAIFTAEQDANPLCLLGTLISTPIQTAAVTGESEGPTLASTGAPYSIFVATSVGLIGLGGAIVWYRRK